jgi:Ca-activated chloride channel family protein
MAEYLNHLSGIPLCVDCNEQGFGTLSSESAHLHILSMKIDVRISGCTAHTDLQQEYINSLETAEDFTFIFPLPPRAVVHQCEIRIGERVIVTDIEERGAHGYEEGEHTLDHSHEDRVAGTFTLEAGSIGVGERARIRLKYATVLESDRSTMTYRFPFVVAPQHKPKHTPPPAQEGSRAHLVRLLDYPNPIAIDFELALATGGPPILDICASLPTRIIETSEEHAYLRMEPEHIIGRDFILQWKLAKQEHTLLALASPPIADQPGHVQVSIVPSANLTATTRPRDIAFVVDRSGSMSGWKFLQVQHALMTLVDQLTPSDRFHLLAFDERTHAIPGTNRLETALPFQRGKAVRAIEELFPRGGTEMEPPLTQALELLTRHRQGDRDAWLVLITDGRPWEEDELLEQLAPHVKGLRLFLLGIGTQVSERFMARLALEGSGTYEQADSLEELSLALEKLGDLINPPVLSNVKIQATGITLHEDEAAPARAQKLSSGNPLIIHSRFEGDTEPDASIKVTGTKTDGSTWSRTVALRVGYHPALGPIWAQERLRDLEEEWARTRSVHTHNAIIACSKHYNVPSIFTLHHALESTRHRARKTNPNARRTLPATGHGNCTFRFISGKYKGGQCVLKPGRKLLIGSASDTDIVLVGDSLSAHHAIITYMDDNPTITDLGSLYGTFVNGERISDAELEVGDHILIGTNLLKLEDVPNHDMESASTPSSAPRHAALVLDNQHDAAPRTRPAVTRSMSGALEEIALPQLLQLFAASKKSGTLVILGKEKGKGEIHIDQGRVVFACIDERTEIPAKKTIFHLISWMRGNFSFEPPRDYPRDKVLHASLDSLLLEGFQYHYELDDLSEQDGAPSLNTKLIATAPLPAPANTLPPEYHAIFTLVRGGDRTVLEALLGSRYPEAKTMQILVYLIANGWVEAKTS